MALPDSLKLVPMTTINDRFIFADGTDWAAGSSDAIWGSQEADADLDMTDVGAGAAEQSSKATLPLNEELEYDVWVGAEFATAPVSGETVDYYKGLSPSATAGTANPGGLSGSSAAYTGTSGDSLDDSLKQLDYIGSLVCTADATTAVQVQHIGVISAPSLPEIMIVADNNTSDAFHSDAAECFVALIGREIQIQDSVTT